MSSEACFPLYKKGENVTLADIYSHINPGVTVLALVFDLFFKCSSCSLLRSIRTVVVMMKMMMMMDEVRPMMTMAMEVRMMMPMPITSVVWLRVSLLRFLNTKEFLIHRSISFR